MTIDRESGRLAVPEIDLSVSSSLSRSEFLKSSAFSGSLIYVRNEPWCSNRLRDIPLPETELTMVLFFYGEQLRNLHLSHGAAKFGSSWATWSEEAELARKAFHEHWLAHELHVDVGEYSWGTIDSYYDSKGGTSGIAISYHRSNA